MYLLSYDVYIGVEFMAITPADNDTIVLALATLGISVGQGK
jgi:hypothetical protein